jgi:2-polyprenyl-6-hydroxyphenyl methylase/3-demethylubiquinone-9 3-methyltransferase
VKPIALEIGADLLNYTSLESKEALSNIPENSIDVVNFADIIEHITFNPINMWKGIYRILKPGGHIYVTTPNSMNFDRLYLKLKTLINECGYGINTPEIFSEGTYGHHWKEFSIPELNRYFTMLSPDFHIIRAETSSFYGETINADMFAQGNFTNGLVKILQDAGAQPHGGHILMDIALPEKIFGIKY